MPDIEGRTAIVGEDVVWIHGKAVGAGRVAICEAERVIAKDRILSAHADIEVGDDLVLVEEAVGLVLEDVPGVAKRIDGVKGIRAWQGRIDIARQQLVDAMGIEIGNGGGGMLADLLLNAYGCLPGAGRLQVRINMIFCRN